MMFYKIIANGQFVGIGTSYDLRKFQKKHSILVTSLENDAQYIQVNELLYRDSWFAKLTTQIFEYTNASIISISENEYNSLADAIQSNEEVAIAEKEFDNKNEEEYIIDPNEEITIEYLKSSKISEMNLCCNNVITNGFDVVLSDKKTHHFSLTIQDQLNIMTLSTLIGDGQELISYHADGELCKYYSVSDIQKIIKSAIDFKTFQITYFNSLKLYIMALNDYNSISEIEYGSEIPLEYQSDTLKELYSQI